MSESIDSLMSASIKSAKSLVILGAPEHRCSLADIHEVDVMLRENGLLPYLLQEQAEGTALS